MGYDIHITRRRQWSDDGASIGADEWLRVVQADSELRLDSGNGAYFAEWRGSAGSAEGWLDWSDGNVYSKNPSPELIDKMVALARELKGTVQGDEGETYSSGSAPPVAFQPSLTGRMRAWLSRRRHHAPIPRASLPFGVGDRVRDIWGNEANVVHIDLDAEHGLGLIRVVYDRGREVQYSAIAHPYTLVSKATTRLGTGQA